MCRQEMVARPVLVAGQQVFCTARLATLPNRPPFRSPTCCGSVICARVALLHLTLLPRSEVHLHMERVGCGGQDRCARLGGSTELAGHLGDSHRLRQEDRINRDTALLSRSALVVLEHLESPVRHPGESVVVGVDIDAGLGVVAERVQVPIQLTDVLAHIAVVQVAVGRHRCHTAAAPGGRPRDRTRSPQLTLSPSSGSLV